MGQQKGNPIPSYQNQAYERLRPNTGIRENRDGGTKPVMIDDNTTLTAVIDSTFATDSAVATLTSQLVAITSSAWNPTIIGDAALFSNTINRKSGFYQKIGNVVQFTLHAEFQNPTASLISAGNFQFDLPVTPNNNWSGSFGLVNGTATLHSNNGAQTAILYVVNGTKRVYFDGNRGGTSAAPTYTHINAQYTIDN